MSILLNGGSNPLDVYYNGLSLDTVYAVVDGVSSVFPVWSRELAYPETITSQIVVSMSDGCKAYFRNVTLSTAYYWTTGGTGADYVADVTIETSFNQGRQIGPSLPYSATYDWYGNGSFQSVSGVPSGYSFISGKSSASATMAFDVYQWSTPGVLKESEKVAMNLQTQVTISSSGQKFVTQPHGNSWPVLTRATGWIYQGAGIITLQRN